LSGMVMKLSCLRVHNPYTIIHENRDSWRERVSGPSFYWI
jgi:hypothetical protein